MFSYVCLGTNDLPAAKAFYDAVLAPLGLQPCGVPGDEHWAGWAAPETATGTPVPALWVCHPFDGRSASVGNGTMVAFQATSWAAVDAFHEAALRHGGRSEGAPGLRLQYAEDFYAAYVRDLDGNKLAVVCRGFIAAP